MPIYNHAPIVFPDTPEGKVLSDSGTWIAAGGSSVWGAITGTLADQDDLDAVLAGKSPLGHGHSPSEITGTAVVTNDARLSDARVPLSHVHAISDTTNLQTTLDGKAASGHNHTGTYEPANANIQTHVGSSHAPANAQANADITKAEIEAKLTGQISSHSHAGGGVNTYAINVQALTSSPVDAQTVYFGMLPKAPTTTAATSKIYVRAACTIIRAEIYVYSGTAGTNQAWSLYIRKNNSADTLIATLSVATNERIFSNAALNISMAAGDYFEIKGIQPTWTTNPATTIYGGYIVVQE